MPRRQTFLCSKGKGNSRGLPSPPRWGPARGPHLQLSLGGPRSSSAVEGGGSRRLATCTFETKQTRSPRAHPAAGHRPLSPRMGSLGADYPQKIPNEPTPQDIPRRSSAVGTHTHPPAHTPTVARAGTTPPPPPRRPKKLSKLSARPRPRPQPSSAPHSPSPATFRPTRPRWGVGRPGRDGGRRGSAPRTCRV